MNAQEFNEAIDEFRKVFPRKEFDSLNVADLADLIIRLQDIQGVALRRIEILRDEDGEQTTPVYVKPGITVKEVDLQIHGDKEVPVLFTRIEPSEFERRIREQLSKAKVSFRDAQIATDVVDQILFAGLRSLTEDISIGQVSQRITLSGFVKYASIRFGINSDEAEKIKDILKISARRRMGE